jgi:DASH complex subunit ASK1
MKGGSAPDEDEDVTQLPPTTPGREQHRLPNMSMTPMSSPFATSYMPSAKRGADVLLHRVMDKNYRIRETPHKTPKPTRTPLAKPSWRDAESPDSSPVMAPQLHHEIFSSPIRQPLPRPNEQPRTPGVPIQTPAKDKWRPAQKDEITWESDSDQDPDDIYKELGMSPPKTIQFVMPASRLLQTPG